MVVQEQGPFTYTCAVLGHILNWHYVNVEHMSNNRKLMLGHLVFLKTEIIGHFDKASQMILVRKQQDMLIQLAMPPAMLTFVVEELF